jgi:hypothetical protein
MTDVNGDGKLDVALIALQDSFGTVYIGTALGNGNGTFQPAVLQSGSGVNESAFRISDDIDVADVNGDSRPDVVVTNYASNDLSVFVTNADATLQPHQRYGAGYGPRVSALGDFDRDGRIDIATAYAITTFGLQDGMGILRNIRAPSAPTVQAAVSRKLHNSIAFDVPLNLTGTPAVEPRRGSGANSDMHQLVITFSAPVTVGSVSASGGVNAVLSGSGNTVIVDLTNVANALNLTVSLNNVSSGGPAVNLTVPVSFLVGDSNGDRTVNAADALQVRNRSGQAADATNFRSDVNTDGFVNTADTLLVRNRSGSSLGTVEPSPESAVRQP